MNMTNLQVRQSIDEELPFVLHLADGRSFKVEHRDFIFLPPKSSMLVIAEDDPENGDVINHRIPLLMITGIESRSKSESLGDRSGDRL